MTYIPRHKATAVIIEYMYEH